MPLDDLGLKGGLIVSCQAYPGDPLYGSAFMVAMAKAAKMAGAKGIRANGPLDIMAIKSEVDLPIIGINKIHVKGAHPRFYITPTFEAAGEVVERGADIVAMHVLPEYDPDPKRLPERIRRIKEELGVFVMADIATVDDAKFAVDAGVDIVATTSARYAYPDEKMEGPAIDLVRELSEILPVPVIAEGHYHRPEECAQAIKAGAYAVVVGAALTIPQEAMRWFVEAIEEAAKG